MGTPDVLLQGTPQTGKLTLTRLLAATSHPTRFMKSLAASSEDPTGFVAAFDGPVVIDEVQSSDPLTGNMATTALAFSRSGDCRRHGELHRHGVCHLPAPLPRRATSRAHCCARFHRGIVLYGDALPLGHQPLRVAARRPLATSAPMLA